VFEIRPALASREPGGLQDTNTGSVSGFVLVE
jgi:hypothetical protein